MTLRSAFMLRWPTAQKIRGARVLYACVAACRALAGAKSDIVTCRRDGLTWRLNLSEGIDLSIYLFGRFERPVGRLIERYVRPGMIALDIGANIGAHALPMAVRVGPDGRVFALEPTHWAYRRLRVNCRLNRELEHVLVPMKVALRSPTGPAASTFYASWNVKADGGEVHEVHRGALRSAEGVRQVTLDEFVAGARLTRLDFIKLDVDGRECDVLDGGRETLEKLRPMVLFEFSPHALEDHGRDAAYPIRLLEQHGYVIADSRGRTNLLASELLRATPHGGSVNVVALPPVPAH